VEDIQRIFETHQFEFFEHGSITFSCGIAETSQSECKPRDLFHIADQAMYQAKSTGKNKTVIYGDGMYNKNDFSLHFQLISLSIERMHSSRK